MIVIVHGCLLGSSYVFRASLCVISFLVSRYPTLVVLVSSTVKEMHSDVYPLYLSVRCLSPAVAVLTVPSYMQWCCV